MNEKIDSLSIKLTAETADVEAALDRVKEKLEAVTVAAKAATEAIAAVPGRLPLLAEINREIADGARIRSS